MRNQMHAVLDTSRSINGKPGNLADLGFSWISMDDGWQKVRHRARRRKEGARGGGLCHRAEIVGRDGGLKWGGWQFSVPGQCPRQWLAGGGGGGGVGWMQCWVVGGGMVGWWDGGMVGWWDGGMVG